MKHLVNTLLAVAVFVLMGGALPTAFADPTVQPVADDGYFLIVDGNRYLPSEVSGPVRHYETPDTSPLEAYSDRHVWEGNGSEWLPCEGGIHWIDNANVLTVSHCLDVPPTTTTTTTEPPPTTTTTTTTTQPPVTTTTAPPTTTTSTTTTTTEPPATTTTLPPQPPDVWCEWDNHDAATGAHEPIVSWWYEQYPYEDFRFAFVAETRDGEFIGSTEFGPTTPGRHDSWVEPYPPVPEDGFVIEFYINGELQTVIDDPACREDVPPETTTTTTTVPVTTTTRPPELPRTGAELWAIALLGVGIIGAGVLAVKRAAHVE